MFPNEKGDATNMSTQPVDREAIPPQLSVRASARPAVPAPGQEMLFPPPLSEPDPHPVTDTAAPALRAVADVPAFTTRPASDAVAPESWAALGGVAGYPSLDAAGGGARVYTTIVAVDIVGFTDRRRDEEMRRHLRHRLYEQLREAFRMTLLPWDGCYREDRGDGALVVVPPNVPPHLLLDPLAHHLLAMLRRANRFASDPARMRLRLAVHSGHVESDEHGVIGSAVNHLFRLVDAPRFREAAATSSAELSMIVSQRLYEEVLSSRGILFPELYRQVEISCKETTTRGWIWLSPGGCRHGEEDSSAQA